MWGGNRLAARGDCPGSTSDSCETGFDGGGKHSIVGVPQLPNPLPGATWATGSQGRAETARAGVDKQAITLYDARQHPAALLIAAKPGLAGHKSGTAQGFCSYQMCDNGARKGCKPAKNAVPPASGHAKPTPTPQHVPYLFHHGG